jgi:histidinol phosphatase-like PHP family hydrolase
MVTIYRAHGLRVIIFTDDHEPAHVHVFGDGQAKINLIGADGSPALVWAEDMKANDLRRAMQLVRDQQEQFIAKWREIHG